MLTIEFIERLKQARIKKGLSQRQLDKDNGEDVTNLSHYEMGENKLTFDVLNKLTNALNVTGNFLMEGSMDNKVQMAISVEEQLSQFQKVAQLSNYKKPLLRSLSMRSC